MRRRLLSLPLVAFGLVITWACGPTPDLTTIKLVPTMTGYYDNGPMPSTGENHLLPSVTFQLKNEGTLPLTNVDLVLAFWPNGADGEKDSKQIRAIKDQPLEPGATGEPITVRSDVGFRSLYPRAEFFGRPEFVDFTIRVFAQRNGRTVKLGEVPVERRLIPAARRDGSRP